MRYTPPFANTSPGLRLLFFIIIMLVSLLFASLLAVLVGYFIWGSSFLFESISTAEIVNPAQLAFLKLMQFANQVGMLVFPAMIFTYFTDGKGFLRAIGFKRPLNASVITLSIALVFVYLPFVISLSDFNEGMKFPEYLSGLEAWMKEQEATAARLTELFLNVKGIPALLINILLIAIMPALGEELVFRGVLLRLFRGWFRNAHFAVIVSAFIFSAIHLQFYGFLPRFVMGLFLGYLYVFSGNIWLPIAAHFVNNLVATIAAYLMFNGYTNTSAEEFGHSTSPVLILASAIGSFLIVFLIHRMYQRQGIAQE